MCRNFLNVLRRGFGLAFGSLAVMALWSTCVLAQNADDGFKPNVDPGAIALPGAYALAVQPDGKILIGGNFAGVGGLIRTRIARLNADDSVDTSFAATAIDDAVAGFVLQPDHRIVVYGLFNQVGAYARSRIARLNVDGSVDSTFNPNPFSSVIARIDAVVLQPDGKLLVGGVFSAIGGAQNLGNIARLNSDGSADATFSPIANSTVYTLALQTDGKIVVGGRFTQINSMARARLARLAADGTLDSAFVPTVDNANPNYRSVYHLATQPDGKILVAGNFATIDGDSRQCLARLASDGSVDIFYAPNIGCDSANGGYASALALQADGRLVVGGSFTVTNGSVADRHIDRVNVDGSGDYDFLTHINTDDAVAALAIQADGNILVGGSFANLIAGTSSAGFIVSDRPYLIRLNAVDGSLQWGQGPGTNGLVYSLATQPDGKIIVAGQFSTLHNWGNPNDPDPRRLNLGRLNSDLTLDLNFVADTSNYVYAIAVQPDGKILVGGAFTSVGGVPRNHIARLNADGSVDLGFDPNADALVYSIALQADGAILVGGSFANIGNFNIGGNYHIPYLARLHTDGSVDPSYAPSPSYWVYTIAMQTDARVMIGGEFSTVGAATRHGVARLLTTGGVDPGFDPGVGTNGGVSNVLLQADGKIVLGGYFGSFAGNNKFTGLARVNADGSVDTGFDPSSSSSPTCLALQLDGKILVGGVLYPRGSQTPRYFTRLNSDGSIDSAYAPNVDNQVFAMAAQPDGRLVVGGAFSTIGGQSRATLARLSTPDAALQSLDISGSNVTWSRSGSGAEIAATPELEFSVAGSLYVPIGPMQRVSGGWRYSGYTPPIGQSFYLRVRAATDSGFGTASSGLIESTRRFYMPNNDVIFANGFE